MTPIPTLSLRALHLRRQGASKSCLFLRCKLPGDFRYLNRRRENQSLLSPRETKGFAFLPGDFPPNIPNSFPPLFLSQVAPRQLFSCPLPVGARPRDNLSSPPPTPLSNRKGLPFPRPFFPTPPFLFEIKWGSRRGRVPPSERNGRPGGSFPFSTGGKRELC